MDPGPGASTARLVARRIGKGWRRARWAALKRAPAPVRLQVHQADIGEGGTVRAALIRFPAIRSKGRKRLPNASQHYPFVYNNMIYGEKILPAFDQSCRMQRRSRYFVTNNGYREELLQRFAACAGTVKVYCSRLPSICNYGNQYAARFPEGIIINCKQCKAMEVISPNNSECRHYAAIW